MASNDKWVRTVGTSNGLGGVRQDLNTGLSYDAEGNVIVPEVRVPAGTSVVQQDQLGVYRRTVFSDGSVETVQTEPAEVTSEFEVVTPVPLPGEKQDVSGTGQDAAFKPKVAPGSKTGKAAEKAADSK